MRQRIIDHMNDDHDQALKDLASHYANEKNEKDVTTIKMTDVNGKGMELLLNDTKSVFINFTKEIELEDVRLELMDMLKVARG